MRRLGMLVAAVALGACSSSEIKVPPGGAGGTGAGGNDGRVFDDHWSPTDPMAGNAPTPAGAQGKVARRLSVDHLRRSIPLLFGGATWTSGANGANENLTVLSRTLGEADYVQVTYNNLQPNPLFAKFMDDMAGQVCGKVVTADKARPTAAERAIVRYPEDVDRNLRFLRLKLHGIFVPDGAMDGLADLRKLYDDTLADGRGATAADGAWLAVCVAMTTAPEFMAY
jgi:hypothetical protein